MSQRHFDRKILSPIPHDSEPEIGSKSTNKSQEVGAARPFSVQVAGKPANAVGALLMGRRNGEGPRTAILGWLQHFAANNFAVGLEPSAARTSLRTQVQLCTVSDTSTSNVS